MKLKNIIVSRDFLGALCVALIASAIFFPSVKNEFAKDLYSVDISVLSIVFSVYFAALAIIISSGDNEFIHYLEKNGYYGVIVNSFKFSLLALFVALIYSCFIYTLTAFWVSNNLADQNTTYLFLFVFLFLYGLFATAISSLDAIKYSEYRVKFLLLRQSDADKKAEAAQLSNDGTQKEKRPKI